MNINKLIIIILTVSFAAVSYAAPIPNIGDVIKQAEPPRDLPQKENAVPEIREKLRPAMKSADMTTIFVKGFTISGNMSIKTDVLTDIANKPENINKNMTFADISAVADQITKYYRANGFFVAKAYIPKQQMTNGIIEIVVLEGKYGKINVNNSSLVSDKRINKTIDKATGQDVITEKIIERQMMLVNQIPGANLKKINIRPGEEFGTSDFDINIAPTPRFFGYFLGDNYGLRYTGVTRILAGAGINSPFGIGDKLFVSGILSTTGGLKNGRASYKLPLNSSGLTGAISYTRTDYSLAEEYDSLDASGQSDTIDLTFSYPLILSKLESSYATLTFTSRQMEDEVKAFEIKDEKDTLAITAELSYKKVYPLFGFRNTSELTGAYKLGKLDFDNDVAEATDAAGADTKGTYHKLNITAKQRIQFSRKWSLTANLQAQQVLTDKNLDGSEDFSTGGVYGVRVFPSSEHSAENGYILNTELFYRLPNYKKLVTMISIFVDTAYAKPQDDYADEGGRSLSDTGAGFYAYYDTLFLKAYYAYALGSQVESEPKYDSRFLLQAGLTF